MEPTPFKDGCPDLFPRHDDNNSEDHDSVCHSVALLLISAYSDDHDCYCDCIFAAVDLQRLRRTLLWRSHPEDGRAPPHLQAWSHCGQARSLGSKAALGRRDSDLQDYAGLGLLGFIGLPLQW